MTEKNTKQKKRIVTEDKKERFKEIFADNKEFESLVHKFIEAEPSKQLDNKQNASILKNRKNDNKND